jgi:hypothetical protein
MTERVVIASTGGWDFPSTRRRFGALGREGPWPVDVHPTDPFPTREQVHALAARGGSGAVLILQRVLPTPGELARLRQAYEWIAFDMDDAIYASPPRVGGSRAVRVAKLTGRFLTRGYPRASARRKPLIRTLRAVDTCVAGNAVLAGFALRYCSRVVEIPTTVDPVPQVPARGGKAALIWVGVADNLQYLSLIADPLARLRNEIEFHFTVVSSRPWLEAPIPTDFVRWTPEAEREALLDASVGVAPLTDDPWTRGKCAFRAILYGGHALATAATPVGITDEVLIDGQTGLLARTKDEWVQVLRDLLENPDRTAEMGQRAWRRIRDTYSDQVALRMWLELLRDARPARRGSPRKDRVGAR